MIISFRKAWKQRTERRTGGTYEVASRVHRLQVLLEEEFQMEVVAFDPVDLLRALYQLLILSNTSMPAFVVTNLGNRMAGGRHPVEP